MAIERKMLPKPTSWDEMFPGRFLKPGLFVALWGTDKPTLTIKDYDLEELPDDDGKDKACGILTWAETSMQTKVNKTNGKCLKAMFGATLRDWVGKKVTLCIERDRDPGGPKGAMCDVVRVFGSPDIDRDIVVTIKSPKRKTQERQIKKTVPAERKQPSKPEQMNQEKPSGNIDEHLAAIAKLGDDGKLAYPATVLSKFSWTNDERNRLTAALKEP